MRNIIQIFLRDVRKLSQNTIALIVVIGILVVPTLYAWFNIGGSWDPYENTSALKVAVASDDEGYQGELLAVDLNMGDEVLTALHENDDLDWVFTDSEKAVEGVKSGKYYAAIVVPETFSRDMMSLFTGDMVNPTLQYYTNAKANAIAPRVTDKGAGTVQTQINETFVETLTRTALSTMQTLVNVVDEAEQPELVESLIGNLEDISSDLSAAAGTVGAFDRMAAATETMLASTSDFLKDAQERSDGNTGSLDEIEHTVKSVGSAMDGTTDSLNTALKSSAALYQQMSQAVKAGIQSAAGSEDLKNTFTALNTQIQAVIDGYTGAAQSLQQVAAAYPQLAGMVDFHKLIGDLQASIAVQQMLQSALSQAAASLGTMAGDALTAQTELDALIEKTAQSAAAVQKDYEENVKSDLDELADSVASADSRVSSLLDSVDAGMDGVYSLSDTVDSDLATLRLALQTSEELLERASSDLSDLAGRLQNEKENSRYDTLEGLLDEGADTVGTFLSAPVTLETESVYEIENYGSAMAPFYSTLAIWVGGVVLVAMLKPNMKPKELEGLTNVKPSQAYLGRYLIFLVLGLLQATLICLGDLYFLGIQCRHPFLFLLAGWLSSVVYVNIIYTLSISFGDIGKAISVILMVMQVAGAGGNFPIEVAPAFFRNIYSALPFVYSMGAMRECVAGLYGNTYWTQMGTLALYLIPSLALGLLLRKPIIRLNDRFTERLESSRLM